MEKRWNKEKGKQWTAGIMAAVILCSSAGFPFPAQASDVWPQKATAPYYCLDGGKGWQQADRYDIYKYDTLPSPLTETQTRRLFWAYPSNWKALKEAAAKYDPGLYAEIASTVSGPNVVKRVKDDAGTKFAWVADNPEIEARAISVMEQACTEASGKGKEAPEAIREATSEDTAVSFTVLPFSDGPGALDTEFVLGSEFIRDIAKIEPQSVWDNGSTGGNVGWLDASQDKNIAKSVMGENLYEVTWSGDSIKIHNNGSAAANENAVGSSMSEEEKYNKTTVRYKITMRGNSGWYTEGSWNDDYLHQWMDFKACVNSPDHQRLYKADMRITPSDMVFYLVISQGEEGESGGQGAYPEYGGEEPELTFQIFRHEETFESSYNVKLKKLDDETGMPLKGSQFYLYERFEDGGSLSDSEEDAGLSKEKISFAPWNGFRVFAEGTTDENGEISHTDKRSYLYSKTYCDGHPVPKWAGASEEEEEAGDGETDPGSDDSSVQAKEQVKDKNRAAAQEWLNLVEACEVRAGDGTHFHWISDEDAYDEISGVLESGVSDKGSGTPGDPEEDKEARGSEDAFAASGCRADCEETCDRFIHLKFTYTWKEMQARTGYILHDLHADDVPVEMVTTVSSEAGAEAFCAEGSSREISENIWYAGDQGVVVTARKERILTASASDAVKDDTHMNPVPAATPSNAWRVFAMLLAAEDEEEPDDSDWKEMEGGDFLSYLDNAVPDWILHRTVGESDNFSYSSDTEDCRDHWIVRDHRTEGKIKINKRDLDLYRKESEEYSSFGDTEGDGTLEGAVYGLFAAEDIIHPDSDIASDGTITNTGIVYRKNDLVSMAATDLDGNAEFSVYTMAPGMTYDYGTGRIKKREDTGWDGPVNLHTENLDRNGNYWIGRPLVLGNYYIKELARSEGYELSVNGISEEWTNKGAGFDTPPSVTSLEGTAVVSMPELMASMEGEDGSGNGFDQLPFTVTSCQTVSEEAGTDGYTILISGLPENTEFYRVDTGEEDVTGPHVTGTEEVPVKDSFGNQMWKTAESDGEVIKYIPEYDADGNISGQIPMSRTEPQILKAEQIPQSSVMKLTDVETDADEAVLEEKIADHDLSDEGDPAFLFLKAEIEEILNRNGYEVPATAGGVSSSEDHPVYSRGVIKGQPDLWGMTAAEGEPAPKTYYGAAVAELMVDDPDAELTVLELMGRILSWYQDNPQWNFGGIDSVRKENEKYKITLYAGASTKGNRRFFTMKEQNGKAVADKVYTVLENPVTLRWVYQEYSSSGEYRYRIDQQYYLGSGAEKRYYMDAVLIPAVLINEEGDIQNIDHTVMVYHKAGEEIIDYLDGDAANGYRIPLTKTEDKIEITTETEVTETDVKLSDVEYDRKTGIYRIRVKAQGTDSYGKKFTDATGRLTLSFMAKLPEKQAILSEEDISRLGPGNVYGYADGEAIGYGEYLIRFGGASVSVSVSAAKGTDDTYIVSKQLAYRGQDKITEDGDTETIPVQVLERPVKQKVRVIKTVSEGEAIGNFRFKIYLKSNLERLFCNEDGEIFWTDKNGNAVDISEYHDHYPELAQKLYTKTTKRRLLETVIRGEVGPEAYNYEKFFDAVRTANTDKWKCEEGILNTSFKPFASGLYTGAENTINSSDEAKENAERSDAVRQFAVKWYLKEEVEAEKTDDEFRYADELYDKALYAAILKAEEYLKPFFLYDIDSLYSIAWDSETNGGIDKDRTTLSAWQLETEEDRAKYAYGISKYLPYGTYVLAEQQPYKAEWLDFANRHYEIDAPKEILLPSVYEDAGEEIPENLSSDYIYRNTGVPSEAAEKYYIRFNEDWTEDTEGTESRYVVFGHSNDGDFKVHPYGMQTDQDAYEGRYAPVLAPWSVTDRDVYRTFQDRPYRVNLRIEKLDAETGEQILHDDGVFALYKAERNEAEDGDGSVKRYGEDTIIRGSRAFLEAMGAGDITPFARTWTSEWGVGVSFYGTVPKGTPICREKDCIVFEDSGGRQTGKFCGFSTAYDSTEKDVFQITGYGKTQEPLEAGVYVLAELKPPAGYVRSLPIPVEVYSDAVTYYPDGGMDRAAAVCFGYQETENAETARIYVNDTATSLEISKKKTGDSYRGMKVSGRVEGSISALRAVYGLENLELAYNSMGTYLGFGWKKGTLEYLENRKASGERVEIVYENGVFQGYGYVTRTLETAEDENRYVAGARMALFEAIEIRLSGDQEDYAFEGTEVRRDRNGNVLDIIVRAEAAGESLRFTETEEGVWSAKPVKRGDTSVLFYDLGSLKVLDRTGDGIIYGYGKDGRRIRLTFDTESVYALRGGRPVFEISGGDLSELVYDEQTKAFTAMDEDTVIYHLDEGLNRDAQVDGYTGLAYVEKSGKGPLGQEESHYYVWPVNVLRDENGTVIGKEKILTGRPGEINAGDADAYITGTWNADSGTFEKLMKPVTDENGMVRYYPADSGVYEKGESLYDRDGDYLGYRFDDLLDEYNRASYDQQDKEALYQLTGSETEAADREVRHRNGEAWIIPNIWITGERTPQDPSDREMTWGQADLLRRVVPGTYILEELNAPAGYVRALPAAVCVEEKKEIQRVSVTEERIKVEIAKTDGTEAYGVPVTDGDSGLQEGQSTEGRGAYGNGLISGAELALYRAKRIYTSDLENYPKGYFMVKTEESPACWDTEDPVDNHPVSVTARWITDGSPQYFEGIPAGDYILEELSSPPGYLPASMEITVKEVPELQSFVMKDDHTKLEIFKYEEDGSRNRAALPWPYRAELALYPAVLETDGSVKMQDGEYVYEKDMPTDIWRSGTFAEYGTAMKEAYETMFLEYGGTFREFSWKTQTGAYRAILVESHSTGNGEIVTQLWKTEDGSKMRITAVNTDSHGKTDAAGRPAAAFEYQINYKKGEYEAAPDMVSYEIGDGLHRIDRIPAGQYVLVETETPPGYQTANPRLITVEESGDVQRYSIENAKKVIYVDKTDGAENQLSGAELALYRGDDGGYLTVSEEYLVDKWNSGTEGVYDADDLAEGTIPDGYAPGDRRLHRLPPIGDGVYYLVETKAPAYCAAMEPQRLEINGSSENIIHAVNHVAKGQAIIEKQDAEWYGKVLSGAWFEIKNTKTGEIYRMVTDESGRAVSHELPVGYPGQNGTVIPFEYEIREIQAPPGYRTESEAWRFRFGESGQEMFSHCLKIENEKTRLWFSKSDFGTGRLVPGARLAIYCAKAEGGKYVPYGEPIETWVSGAQTHQVVGKLSGKQTYFLVEEEAPGGYTAAPPVMFTVSADGKRILEVTDDFREIRITYEINSGVIRSVSVPGRTVTGGSCVILQGEKEILRVPVSGEIVIPAEEKNGELLTLCECIEFSDGTAVVTENETFRLNGREEETVSYHRRIPVRTEYVLSDENGRVIERWRAEEDETFHEIANEQEESGDLRFAAGETCCIEEIVCFDDGTRAVTGKTGICIGEDGSVSRVDMKDRKTEVRIKKTDMATGEELPGAVLTIRDGNGTILEKWTSGTEEYVLNGSLRPGETYTLSEETAPEGYLVAEEVTFTVSSDGRIDRVIMEDGRKGPEKPEEPEEPEKPEKPEEPEEPEQPEEPDCPERDDSTGEETEEPDKTDRSLPQIGKTAGIITAFYDTGLNGSAEWPISHPGRVLGIQRSYPEDYRLLPETGDPFDVQLWEIGFLLAVVSGILFAMLARRKKHEE